MHFAGYLIARLNFAVRKFSICRGSASASSQFAICLWLYSKRIAAVLIIGGCMHNS